MAAAFGAAMGPPPVDPTVAALFTAVDTDGSGAVAASELQSALSSGGWTKFDIKTVLLMIKMFDTDWSGTISVAEFGQLWTYLGQWKATFDAYDTDKSGSMEMGELNAALQRMGYRLSAETFAMLTRAYDSDKSGKLGFDEFVLLFVELNLITNAFARLDTARSGTITITYDQFIGTFMSTK